MSIIGRIRAWRGPRALSEAAPASPYVGPTSPYEGYVDELSPHHVAGWLTGPAMPRFTAMLPTGETLAQGPADQFKFGPSHEGRGHHGFFARLSRTLNASERAALLVRAEDGSILAHHDKLIGEYRPIMLNAMDIVDNCNLRCPFCVYDYSRTFATNMMDEATIEAALRFLPYTLDSNFWFSCLHEPTLHPAFTDYLDLVPRDLRRKVFFTTNLAKRMKPAYFRFLADGGFANVNISIESLDPAIYERMRKGAKHRIFMENWDALVAAFERGSAPPFLRYIVLVYNSNLREIPSLVDHLLTQRRADEIQLRFTFDVPWIPQAFRDAEYVRDEDWDWVAAQVAHYPSHKVQVIRSPAAELPAAQSPVAETPAAVADAPSAGVVLPGRYEFETSWDGTIKVKKFWAIPFELSREPPVAVVNLRDISDPLAFFASLPA